MSSFYGNIPNFIPPSLFTSFIVIPCAIISGFSIGLFIVAQFIYPSWQKSDALYEIIQESDEEEEDDEDYELEEEEDEDYTLKYKEEFDALSSRSLSVDEIKALKFKIVEEFVKIEDIVEHKPDQEPEQSSIEQKDERYKKIIMTYNNETESFWYYTDHSTKILYPLLDMVARKFVITYDCKDLYICLVVPPAAAVLDEVVAPIVAEAKADDDVPMVKSIFAKFKSYSTMTINQSNTNTLGGGKNKNSITTNTEPIIKKTNQFKYKGKLNDYLLIAGLDNDEEDKQSLSSTSAKIDYASFKKQFNLNKI